MKQIPLLLAGMALLAIGNLAHCATITWTNASGGNWSDANNWSPHQSPSNTDSVLITTPGSYNVVVDSSGVNVYININNLTVGAGGGVSGVQTLYVTNSLIGFSVLNSMLVTNGGVFTVGADNTSVGAATMTVADSGVLNVNAIHQSFFFGGTLVVTNGGVVYANGYHFSGAGGTPGSTFSGPVRVENGGWLVANNILVGGFEESWFSIGHGGMLTGSGTFAALTNAGMINLTNTSIRADLLNQPGGVVNLAGGAGFYGNSFGGNYFTNLGAVIASGASPNTISAGDFENGQGTVTNLSGVLLLGTITNLTGTYFAAAGATNQFAAIADGTNYATAGAPLVLAGPGSYQFISGDLLLPTDVIPNLALLGGQLKLGASFQGGAITNLTLSGITLMSTLPVTGKLDDTGSSILGNLLVASGGTLNANLGAVYSLYPAILSALTVAHGGTFNVTALFKIYYPLTNSGTINLSNAAASLLGGGTIDNQSGGLINILGSSSIAVSIYGSAANYFANRGVLLQNSPGVTNLTSLYNFDNSQGTVTNLSGTLGLGFQGNLVGTYFAATGATINFANNSATPMTAETPLTLGGPGVIEFKSGLFSLPTNPVPGLVLAGGALVLGPGFQGGAITNLTLAGIGLTNTLPVTGTFTATNHSALNGNFTVANGGLFNCAATLNGFLTVANGGVMSLIGGSAVNSSGALTVANGGTLNIIGTGMTLFGPLTNAGTLFISNSPPAFFSGVLMGNDGAFYHGGLLNQSSGQIIFASDGTIFSTYSMGNEYFINQGHITKSAGTNVFTQAAPLTSLGVAHTTNSGAITAQTGFITAAPFTLLPGSSLNVGIGSATNYGSFRFSTNIVLGGAFNATLNNGYVPANGTMFNVLIYTGETGTFSSLGLPPAVSWQTAYGATNFTLIASSASPQFGALYSVGTNLVLNGIGGSPGSNYVVLASTNLAIPLTNWLALTTNTFDIGGQFRYTNNASPAKPSQFFIFKLP